MRCKQSRLYVFEVRAESRLFRTIASHSEAAFIKGTVRSQVYAWRAESKRSIKERSLVELIAAEKERFSSGDYDLHVAARDGHPLQRRRPGTGRYLVSVAGYLESYVVEILAEN
ncbi:hypothetical protein EVAR_49144_1 [Eumeta japonica]|uniref:Uncharacterized protein n=1 Tax=Eumeta variegata TaxID=151549 RepID=A0A4C1ZBZ2_EUMVA|nr:hypothetical protein EVAR_49144_1 [Eumeta japonica]